MDTTSWRSSATSDRTRASPSTRAGSIDCTGSSITRNRNGFAGNVARGKKTERARQLISPLLAAGQGLRLRTVDINGLVNVAPGAGTRQLHGSKINVALEPELFPEPQGLEFDGLPSSSP